MKTRILRAEEPGAIQEAAKILLAGGVVAFPTDTVYGVGAHPFTPAAISALYEAKGRPKDKAIPLLLADKEDLPKVTRQIPEAAWRLANKFWPGGLTLILPRAEHLPAILCAGYDTLAVRVPDHPVALALIAAAGGAVATTSANQSGDPPALTAEEALAALGGQVDLLLDGGRVPGGVASTILDLTATPARILRPGPIPAQALFDTLHQ